MPSNEQTKMKAARINPAVNSAFDSFGIFGDNRGTTEDAMMASHAQDLQASGVINKAMQKQLSQAWHKTGELEIKYNKQYLAMHPDYVGSNAHDMPSYEEALRLQDERDAAQEKLLADFAAGIIDANCIPITESDSDLSSLDSDMDICEYEHGDTSSTAAQEQSTQQTTPEPVAQPPRPIKAVRAPKKSEAIALSASKTSVTKSKLKRAPPSTKDVRPLAPAPGKPDYQGFEYNQLAALCRTRNLPGGGNTQTLRNTLIRDDINVATGNKREKRTYKPSRKQYKTEVPKV